MIRKMHHVYLHITDEQYEDLFNAQNGCCAICGTHQSELSKRLSVDHDHNTGEVRGLLCQPCNLGIGYFRENADRLSNAINYVSNAGTGIYLSDTPARSISPKSMKTGDWRRENLTDEFVSNVSKSSIRRLMQEFGISRSTAFLWKQRVNSLT